MAGIASPPRASPSQGERLRGLLFGAEKAEAAGDMVEAQSLWLQLLQFLQAGGATHVTTAAHGSVLARLCTQRLHAILCQSLESGVRLAPASFAGAPAPAAEAPDALGARLAARSRPYAALLSAARAVVAGPPRKRGGDGRPAVWQGVEEVAWQGDAEAPHPSAPAAPDAAAARKRDARGVVKPDDGASVAGRWARGGEAGPPGPPPAAPRVLVPTNAAPPSPPPGAPPRGFTSARAKLQMDDMRAGRGGGDSGRRGGGRGRGFDACEFSSGDMFPNGAGVFHAGRRGAPGRGGFVPPFVQKALGGPPGGPGAGAGGGAGGGHGAPAAEAGPLSERTLRLLAAPDGSLPEALAKLDPALLEAIASEVLDDGPPVAWDDIAGQDDAKRLVQELVVWPMLNPHLFTGARAPPRGLLLFGPPGTGKTLLGRAVASNVKATFFSISASSLTSKWIGEGEKLVRTLFAVATAKAPAVVFIDELDSILAARRGDGGEHEASRRLKTEILIQMEGCAGAGAGGPGVLVIGATNRPEELDEAARRRLPKQLYVPLPCPAARRAMLARALLRPGGGVSADLPEPDVQKVVAKTEGYSGSDMRALIQEACQGPVRDALRGAAAAAAGGGGAPDAALAALRPADLRPVVLRDFAAAARAQRASVGPGEVARYEAYNAKHGAKYVGRSGGAGGGSEGGGAGDAMDEDGW